ncbi:NAD/NADP octopine/nopaline dehydrogenase family protein [Sutcliffiella cohnii]|uniref:NAD/NADP octopine/nopaline dehydrogenase family protein n=1 Tax=Sutcliffiella sp. NC1 TaxID=3004096 RepID=UPI0022DE463C|nr:NAD/NADP-dependent octopine/nopaline dehydrogenase family protein [Sutcliffiella sp. NC1]WBL14736.1 NAD/NADP octopine/nopaline dehydrogenase family protein [Sutcliffiella sp. NC1]
MKVTVIGAGNGGLALGGVLSNLGIEVKLYDKFNEVIEPIKNNGNSIKVITDYQTFTSQFNIVTTNLASAIEGSNYLLVVTPAFAHRELAQELTTCIKEDQRIILIPGRTGGAIEVRNILSKQNKHNIVAETDTLFYACRKTNPTTVQIYGIKRNVGIGSIPASAIKNIVDDFSHYLPYLKPYENVLYSSLNNIGAIFHPTPFLLNIGNVDRKHEFTYYHQGITPFIASFLEEMDKERIAIASALSIQLPTAIDWVKENYNVIGKTMYEVIQANKNYGDILAPTDVFSRYTLEDIPMSLVPLTEIAKLLEVKTPYMNDIINLGSRLYKKDFRSEGRNLQLFGINSKTELTNIIEGKFMPTN